MNKAALLFILLIILNITHSAAQTDGSWSIITPQECRFSGEFSQQKFLIGLDRPLVSTGVFFYDCQLGIIWKTLTPNTESLVLNKSGASYLVKRLKIEAIQSAQNKLVSQLIMALVSGDENYLSNTFEQSSLASNETTLTPKSRRLKRAIKSITLAETATDQISFELLDQNQQITSILSTVLLKYPAESTQSSETICVDVTDLDSTECGLLKTETN